MKRIALCLLCVVLVLAAACSREVREEPERHLQMAESVQDSERARLPPPPSPPTPREPTALDRIEVAGLRLMPSQQAPGTGIAPAVAPVDPYTGVDRERYASFDDNPIRRTDEHPVSTFSIDVDTGSYSNVRRMLAQGRLPPADAVRAEELLNYFDYGYPQPGRGQQPFSVTTELAPAPWHSGRHLLLVGLQGYKVAPEQIPASNLVYLIDTSGSMYGADRIELLKRSFALMTRQLRPQDRVAIVTYAGSAGLVLNSTPGDRQDEILAALDQLYAGGSTNGGAGIKLAYAVARSNFIEGGVNRVILASDGDFNVGVTGVEALKNLVSEQRRSGVGLTVLGFGGGNYNDQLAEQLANNGNGSYHYIDTLDEGRKVLVDQLSATMLTIAEDVKIQIEFNPAVVEEYRLIGYENRVLRREDFNNDQVDAGEIGAGHSVTALYELTLVGSGASASDPLRYQPARSTQTGDSDELAWLRLRYKDPGAERSQLLEQPVPRSLETTQAGERLRFAAAVAGFADLLRGGRNLQGWRHDEILSLANASLGEDRDGYRAGFVALVERARELSGDAPIAATIAD